MVRAGNDPRVREESHLDDMRAAIRGDFERLADRRGSQELMQEPAAEPEPPEEPVPELPEEPVPDSSEEPVLESSEEPEEASTHPVEAVVEESPAEPAEPAEPPRRSLLTRLLGL
jgi:hypothetical protein